MHVSTLTNDYYQFDPLHQQLIGENFRRRYRLGDKVRVKVMGVNLDDRKIDFVMVEEPLKATGKNAKEMARKQQRSRKRRPRAHSVTKNVKRARITANPTRAVAPNRATDDRAKSSR